MNSCSMPYPFARNGAGGSHRATLPPRMVHMARPEGGSLQVHEQENILAWKLASGQLERFATQPTQLAISALRDLQDDWDGMGSVAPSAKSIATALGMLPELYLEVGMRTWEPPHVSSSEDGEVTFEWWAGQRKLTLYFGDDQVFFIKVWGTDIDNEMSTGRVDASGQFAEAWEWLAGA